MAKEKYCKVCGRSDRKILKDMCPKHYEQVKIYKFPLDTCQRDELDLNEITIHNDYVTMSLYDKHQEELEEKVILDVDIVDKIKNIRWNKKHNCIIGNVEGKTVLLSNYIMGIEQEKVTYANGNYLDNRKENLNIIYPKEKKSKQPIVSKKNKNKIIVEFVAKSQSQVTGSSILISYPTKDGEYKKVLVELGANQTNKDLYSEYLLNKEIVESVPHNELEYVFVCHVHYDHIGNLPSLIPGGFKGRVIATHENAKLLEPILIDGAFIMNKNVKSINSKKHNIEPLYTESDVYLALNRLDEYSKNNIHQLNEELSFQFIEAGHILGSCQLVLYIKLPSGQKKKIHITSDLGSVYNKQPFVKNRDTLNSSSVSIFEATYNDLERGFSSSKEVDLERQKFKEFIKTELTNRRSLLIGVFAQSRQQTMMEFLYNTFKDDKDFNYPIYVDGVLGLNLNNVYLSVLEGEEKEYWKEVMSWKNFKYISSYEKSIEVALNKDDVKICLSSSGMFSNGRIMNHVKSMIENPKSTFVICGYQSEGTVGSQLQRSDNNIVKIDGVDYKKRCNVYQMNTWSSHIMAMENIKYMSQIKTPLIILHHSDETNKYKFRDTVEEELRKRNNSAKIVCASDENNIFYI